MCLYFFSKSLAGTNTFDLKILSPTYINFIACKSDFFWFTPLSDIILLYVKSEKRAILLKQMYLLGHQIFLNFDLKISKVGNVGQWRI